MKNVKNSNKSSCPVFGLYKTSRILVRVYSKYLEPFGLTYPQYLVLLYLSDHSEASVDDIGSSLLLDSGTLTPLLKRLQAKGYISRDIDPKDERKRIVSLTKKGISFQSNTKDIQQKVGAQFNLHPETIKNLNSVLNEILDSYEQ